MTSVEREARRGLVVQAGRRMEAAGVCWADWARRHGFRRHSVMKVVRGQRACLHGECFRIGAALIEHARPPSMRRLSTQIKAHATQIALLEAVSEDFAELLGVLEELAGLCETAVVAVEPGCETQWADALHRAHRVAERVRSPEAGEKK